MAGLLQQQCRSDEPVSPDGPIGGGDGRNNLKSRVVHAAKWAYLAESVNRLLRPVVTIWVARLLTPEDYGVVSLAIAIITGANLLWHFGLSVALIQRQDRVDEAANVTFWFNTALALVVTTLLILLRNPLGSLFQEPRVAEILPAVSLMVLFRGTSLVHDSMLKRKMAFDRLFWRSTIPSLFPLVISLPLALAGYGYWALVWGAVAGSAFSAISLWFLSGWRPSWQFDPPVAKEMFKFGLPTMGSGVQQMLESQLDRILIGLFLGVREVGIYSLGVTIFKLFFEFIFTPVNTVGYAALCRAGDNRERLTRMSLSGQKLVALVALPLGVGLAVVSPLVEQVVFAGRYPGLAMVMTLLAFYFVAIYVQILFAPIFNAAGQPKVMLKINLLVTALILVFYPLGMMMGFNAFILLRGGVALLSGMVAAYLLCKVLDVGGGALLSRFTVPAVGAAVMGGVVYVAGLVATRYLGLEMSWLMLSFLGLIGVVVYGGMVVLLDREGAFMVWRLVAGVVGGEKGGGKGTVVLGQGR